VVGVSDPEILTGRLESEVIVSSVFIVALEAAVAAEARSQHALMEVPKFHDIVVLAYGRIAGVLFLLASSKAID
jgi:hypothetical protein